MHSPWSWLARNWPRLAEHRVDQRGLAVVDVGDDGHVADVVASNHGIVSAGDRAGLVSRGMIRAAGSGTPPGRAEEWHARLGSTLYRAYTHRTSSDPKRRPGDVDLRKKLHRNDLEATPCCASRRTCDLGGWPNGSSRLRGGGTRDDCGQVRDAERDRRVENKNLSDGKPGLRLIFREPSGTNHPRRHFREEMDAGLEPQTTGRHRDRQRHQDHDRQGRAQPRPPRASRRPRMSWSSARNCSTTRRRAPPGRAPRGKSSETPKPGRDDH